MHLLEDIQIESGSDELVYCNQALKLRFKLSTGDWSALTSPTGMQLEIEGQVQDVLVDGDWLTKSGGMKLIGYEYEVEGGLRSASLRWVFELANGWELSTVYTLYPRTARLERSARLVNRTAQPGRLERIRFILPGLALGDPENCVLDAPGPFPYYEGGKTILLFPNTPLSRLAGQDCTISSAPDWGFGILALSNPQQNVCSAAWMETGGMVNFRSGYRSDGSSIDFRFDDERASWIQPGQALQSDIQVLIFTETLEQALAEYRRTAAAVMPLAEHAPDWVREMVILEVFPKYFKGGFKELEARLPFYQDVGINTVYIMPHWTGMYAPLDFYAVDPAYGSASDLKDVVNAAHRLGMHVLFDMVIHGFDPESPVLQEHPEFFNRDGNGQIALHPEWKSATVDWRQPDYRRYMADLAHHHAVDYGFDGYRVDAASFKGPNWDPTIPYPAYASGCDAPDLLRGMLAAARRANPEAVLLNEVFGPLYYSICDLAHDNMTMGPQIFLEKLALREADARDYKRHMQAMQDLLPPGALRVYFARNHDTSWFYHFNGYTPQFMALDAIHALFAIPEIFAGDSDYTPNPDDDPATFAFYQAIYARRRVWPEFSRGEILLREITCDHPLVFSGGRRLNGRLAFAAVSLSSEVEQANLNFPVDVTGDLELVDAISAEPVAFFQTGRGISLSLQPCQVVVGRL